MILRDSINTFTTDLEDIIESPIWNANTSITIGDRPKSQADSERLQIDSEMLLTNTEYIALNAILTNFNEELFYTPTRILYGRSSIVEIKVIAKSPKFKTRTKCNDELSIIFTITYEEVID